MLTSLQGEQNYEQQDHQIWSKEDLIQRQFINEKPEGLTFLT